MIKHYFTIATRNLMKNKLFSLINLSGLAMGMAACILILLYLQFELSFDRNIPNSDRVYRILTIDKGQGVSSQYVAIALPPLGPTLVQSFPEVESYCRLTGGGPQVLEVTPTRQIEVNIQRSADSTLFDVFGFKLLKGNPKTALTKPYTGVITESLAKIVFGSADPMGKTIKLSSGLQATVTGVAEDLPENSHITFDIVLSMKTLEALQKAGLPPGNTGPTFLESWTNLGLPTYVRLKQGSSAATFEKKVNKLYREKGVPEPWIPSVQPVQDVHLKSTGIIFDTNALKGDASSIYTLSAVAILILLIASVNYMNLSTARVTSRAKEVGLRKVVGSERAQLIWQFIGESILLATLSMIVAIAFAELMLPWLNGLTGYHLKMNYFHNPVLILCEIGLILIVGVLAGFYPALVLSGFKPIDVLKGAFHSSHKGQSLRRILVVFQFTLSIGLICGTIVVNKQLHFIWTKDQGYNREQVLILNLGSAKVAPRASAIRADLNASSFVVSTGTTVSTPGSQFSRNNARLENDPSTMTRIWSQTVVDYDFMKTLDMKIIKGRGFSRDYPGDSLQSVVINEAAAREMGTSDPVGKKIYQGSADSVGATVIGVVKDFHFASIREKVEPMIIFLFPRELNLLCVRLKSGSVKAAMVNVESIWKKQCPGYPFSYRFMDQDFERMYRQEINFSSIVNAFSGLAIFIACLGLYGLASHSTEQRRKEIGIRKVMGASVITITRLLIIDFIKWVLLANVIAWPVAYWVSDRWLANYQYRIDQSLLIFPLAGTIALLIAIISIYLHVWRAARENPIKSIRYE